METQVRESERFFNVPALAVAEPADVVFRALEDQKRAEASKGAAIQSLLEQRENAKQRFAGEMHRIAVDLKTLGHQEQANADKHPQMTADDVFNSEPVKRRGRPAGSKNKAKS